MKIKIAILPNDLKEIKKTAEISFSSTSDSSIDEWFSFLVMEQKIKDSQGLCIKAIDDNNSIAGIIYAQQENPINGVEGTEKWVIILAAVLPKFTGQGVGSKLLRSLEKQVVKLKAKKMFIFTNKDDKQVINFYKKNGYEDAGWIKDYQYGKIIQQFFY